MITINWNSPFKIKYGGINMFRREWKIPSDIVSPFFNWWRTNKFKFIGEGFSVYKKGNDWYLTETKINTSLFKKFEKEPEKTIPQDDNFTLIPTTVKNTDGLRPWQIDSVGTIISCLAHWGSAIDGSDLGVGKSYVACGVARELDYNIVIVCPKSVMESWRRIIHDHFNMGDKLTGIINYEQLKIGKKNSEIASFIKNRKTNKEEFVWKISKKTLIVFDESQKLKNWKTKNSKTCISALKQGYKMLFCSATAAINPLELKTVGMCIRLFNNSKQYYKWIYEHGVERGRFGLEFDKNNRKNDKFLIKLNNDIFNTRGVRLRRDTIPNFPESEIISECYNMDQQDIDIINKINDEMENELTELEKKQENDGDNKLTIIIRQRQKIELVKIPLIVDMVKEGIEQGMSVVVFVNFTDTINALSDRLNTKCIFDGKTPEHIRQQNVDNFQSNKERVILVNAFSGGAGLSLHDLTGKYPRLSLISPNYSAVVMRQCTGRVWRDSAKTKSIQKILFVAGTIEDSICQSVKQKLNNLDMLNNGDLTLGVLKND